MTFFIHIYFITMSFGNLYAEITPRIQCCHNWPLYLKRRRKALERPKMTKMEENNILLHFQIINSLNIVDYSVVKIKKHQWRHYGPKIQNGAVEPPNWTKMTKNHRKYCFSYFLPKLCQYFAKSIQNSNLTILAPFLA